MAERLRRIRDEMDVSRNPFLNGRRAAYFRQVLAGAAGGTPDVRQRFLFAHELLLAGETEEAVLELERLEAEGGMATTPSDSKLLRDELVIAYLRLAEEENCCARHNPDSCFVPIRGGGLHSIDRGSRGAIRYLTEALREDPDDLTSRWLLNVAFMTLGEHPGGVPPQWLIPLDAFASDYDLGRFSEVAGQLGLDIVALAGGVAMEDFDNDGDLDIMSSSWSLDDQIRYFTNNSDGTFTDATERAGLTGITGGLNMNHVDYDNDGFADVFVLRGAWQFEQGRHPKSLLRNNGDGTFEDVTDDAGLLSFHPTQAAAWGDYNNDGWVDLYIGQESNPSVAHPCELYRNNGDGSFTECAAEAGVAHVAFVKGVAFGDYDNDGLPDLYLSVLDGSNVLFHNDGAGRFTDMTQTAGVRDPHKSFPTWFFDYDNDGWLDILVFGYGWSSVGDVAADYLGLPSEGERPRLYRNNGDGTFADVTKAANLDRTILAMGANFGDLDNDGFLDFYAATGTPDLRAIIPNLMYRNDGGKSFQDVTTSGGFGNIQKGHGVAFGDLDNDGDQDIYTDMGGAHTGDVYPNLVFENPGHGNHWITLKLQGIKTNRSAIGARIRVRVETAGADRDIHAVVSTGGSFGSSSLQQEIGLGKATSIRFIEVTWPVTGETRILEGLAMDRAYLVPEGGQATQLESKRFRLTGE